MNRLERWINIALINLTIVALLGLILRCKMSFSIPFINFKNLLHAHSHFAFGGWITLALLALITYRIIPVQYHKKPVYKWLFTGILINAYGMLISFPAQGYGLYAILFSTFFIFVLYGFAYVFIKDLFKSGITKPVKLLATGAVAYMTLSSAGPFTLAYLLATKSSDIILYKDAIYTYLHLQYNGFFTLAVFALLLHFLKSGNKSMIWFAHLLNASVIPSMFISYLWHYPGMIMQIIAIAGSILTILSVTWFFIMLLHIWPYFGILHPLAKKIALIALASFVIKMVFQALTIIPSLGALIFTNRPVIIGFLHLVLLGFITLYLLADFIQSGLLSGKKSTVFAIWVFIAGILLNEVTLFMQGFGFMLMMSSSFSNWLLLAAGACLFSGALLITISEWKYNSLLKPYDNRIKPFNHSLNHKNQ